MSYEIFLSYARSDNVPRPGDDEGWVSALHKEIIADHCHFSTEPLRIFFDRDNISSMDDWRNRIQEGLRQSRILLVCLSPNYFQSNYCRWEWEEYARRQVHALIGQDSIAPIYFIEVPGSDEQANAAGIGDWLIGVRRNIYTDLRPWFPQGVKALREEAVRERIAGLGLELWQRIQRARRATGVPGNLRQPNPRFIGRTAELRSLHEKLSVGAVGVVTAVHGMGGQGKTELAIAYAHGWADYHRGGLWVLAAEGRKELLPLLGDLCRDLEIPLSVGLNETADRCGRRALAELKRRVTDTRDRLAKEIEHLKRQLTQEHIATDPAAIQQFEQRIKLLTEDWNRTSCLVLLDNVSEPSLLSEPQLTQMPREDWLHLVATTRLGENVLTASRRKSLAFVAVDAMKIEDAARLIEDHQPDGRWPSASAAGDVAAAREIARELGGFTLAVEAVGIYLGLNPHFRPAEYLNHLRAEGLPRVDELPAQADVAMGMHHREKQFRLVLDQTLITLSPAEQTALEYAALLPPDHVPWKWLRAVVLDEFPDALARRMGYPDPWAKMQRRLEGMRLLTPGDHPEIARLHRIVSAHLKERLSLRAGDLLSRLKEKMERFARDLHGTWEETPTALWESVPIQEALRQWCANQRDAPLGRTAHFVGDIELAMGRLEVAGSLLRLAHECLATVFEDKPRSAKAARDVSNVLLPLGDYYRDRGKPGDAEEALRCFRESLEISRELLRSDPQSVELAMEVSWSESRLGDIYQRHGQPEQALRCLEESLEIKRRLFVIEQYAGWSAHEASETMCQLGGVYLRRGQRGDVERALRLFTESLEIRKKFYDAYPNSPSAAQNMSKSLYLLGDLYLNRGQEGDSEAALRCLGESLEIRRKLYEANPKSTRAAENISGSLNKLGDYYLRYGQQGDTEDALRCFQEALKIHRKSLAADPQSGAAAIQVSISLYRLGEFYRKQMRPGNAEEAFRCLRESLEIQRKLHADDPKSAEKGRLVLWSLNSMGDLHLRNRNNENMEEAQSCFREALRIAKKLYAANQQSAETARDLSSSLGRLGDFLCKRWQPADADEALLCYQESLNIHQQLYNANPKSAVAAEDLSISLGSLGTLLAKRGRSGDGERVLHYFREALEIRKRLYAINPQSARAAREMASSLERLGHFCWHRWQKEDPEEALRCYRESLEFHQQLYAADPQSVEASDTVSSSLAGVAGLILKRANHMEIGQGLQFLQRSLRIDQELYDANQLSANSMRRMGQSHRHLGHYLQVRWESGDWTEALRCFERSLEIAERLQASDPQSPTFTEDVIEAMLALAIALGVRGRLGSGMIFARRALFSYEQAKQKGIELDRRVVVGLRRRVGLAIVALIIVLVPGLLGAILFLRWLL